MSAFNLSNEKTEREKRSRVTYLVQAASLKGAMKGIENVMGGTMIDYEACAIDVTKLMDVFEYGKRAGAERQG